jgi:hypothetical protein
MSGTADHAAAMRQIAYTATRSRRQDLLAALVRQQGWTVQSGPFAGMILPDRVSWNDGDLLPKLLGFYEAELHPVIGEITAAAPDLVVNVGAAEGYYAVGMSRLLPAASVLAFDTEPKSQEICRLAAMLNDLGNRVSVGGQCTPDVLQTVLLRGRTQVVICDCEGYERELIDPERVPALRTATLVVECHDFADTSITQTLVDRLSPSHTLTRICEGARDPNQSPFLRRLGSLDRWLAVCEYRPAMMHWIIANPK